MPETSPTGGEQGVNPLSPNHAVRDLIIQITPTSDTMRYADDNGDRHNVIVRNFTVIPSDVDPNLLGFVIDANAAAERNVPTMYYLEDNPGATGETNRYLLRVEVFDVTDLFSVGDTAVKAALAFDAVDELDAARDRGDDIATPEQTQALIALLTAVRDRGVPL